MPLQCSPCDQMHLLWWNLPLQAQIHFLVWLQYGSSPKSLQIHPRSSYLEPVPTHMVHFDPQKSWSQGMWMCQPGFLYCLCRNPPFHGWPAHKISTSSNSFKTGKCSRQLDMQKIHRTDDGLLLNPFAETFPTSNISKLNTPENWV